MIEKAHESKLSWDDKGWPELTCPRDGSSMGWLGSYFWLCYECKTNRIYGGVLGYILRGDYQEVT
jgi:hypothetical protein